MFWELALVFISGFIGSVLGSILARLLVKGVLHSEKTEAILKPMSRVFKGESKKRTPRANTDLIAYTKELQEQGENRG